MYDNVCSGGLSCTVAQGYIECLELPKTERRLVEYGINDSCCSKRLSNLMLRNFSLDKSFWR